LEEDMNAAPLNLPSPRQVTTRDAEIEGQIIPVSAGRHGAVRRVLVADNELVKRGESLIEMLGRPAVRAPVEGRVVEIDARPYEVIGGSHRLISILQSDDVWIVANFHRKDLEQLHAGQRASIHAAQWVFPARVEFVSPTDGSALLEFVRPAMNPAAVLRPGAPAEVVVEVGSH
jgi:multidrug resistance efflux pump